MSILQIILLSLAGLLAILVLCGVTSRVNLLAVSMLSVVIYLFLGKV